MPDTLVYITPAKKEFGGSSFALWKFLKLRRMETERISIGEKHFLWIRLPVTEAELPLLSPRNSSLLLSRLKEAAGSRSLTLLHTALRPLSFFSALNPKAPEPGEVFALTVGFLPQILACMQRQWGTLPEGNAVALWRKDEVFFPIAQAVSPYVGSISVLGDPPPYEDQDAAWDSLGLAVCNEECLPRDCSLLLVTDPAPSLPPLPKKTLLFSFSAALPGALTPGNVYFRLPGALSSLAAPLGGITAELLPHLLRVFYDDSASFESAKRAGFSVSRITLPTDKI